MYPDTYSTLPVRSSPGIYPTRELHRYYPDIYPPNTVDYKQTSTVLKMSTSYYSLFYNLGHDTSNNISTAGYMSNYAIF